MIAFSQRNPKVIYLNIFILNVLVFIYGRSALTYYFAKKDKIIV